LLAGNRDVERRRSRRGGNTCSRSLEMPGEQKQIRASGLFVLWGSEGTNWDARLTERSKREEEGSRQMMGSAFEKKLAGGDSESGGHTLARRVQGVCAEHNTEPGL